MFEPDLLYPPHHMTNINRIRIRIRIRIGIGIGFVFAFLPTSGD